MKVVPIYLEITRQLSIAVGYPKRDSTSVTYSYHSIEYEKLWHLRFLPSFIFLGLLTQLTSEANTGGISNYGMFYEHYSFGKAILPILSNKA